MIARTWRGTTSAEDADAYLDYLHRTGLKNYRATPGNLATFALLRRGDTRAEFLLVTLWESMDAIKAFSGPEPDRAVFYPEDDRFLIERGERVDHFDVVLAAVDQLAS
jgi:heme-degrading monooxygenase HmoA